MANQPAKAGPTPGLAPAPDAASPRDPAAPPPVHHEAPVRRDVPGHRRTRQAPDPETAGLAPWVLYLTVLAGVAAGLFITWLGSENAARGTGIVGCSLLAAALARLVLPPRFTGPLSSRRKTPDVLAFTAFGAGVLGVALMLP